LSAHTPGGHHGRQANGMAIGGRGPRWSARLFTALESPPLSYVVQSRSIRFDQINRIE
jgi:hypothetical protein